MIPDVPPTVDHDQEVDHELQREVRIEPEQLDAERAAQAREARADGEGRGEHRAHRDAQPARHPRIVDGGAQAAAEARVHQPELQAERQRAADHDQERAVDADIDAEHLAPALQPGGRVMLRWLEPMK